jgi:hypothetical protein
MTNLEITLTIAERALLADVVAFQEQRKRDLERDGYRETVYGIIPTSTWNHYNDVTHDDN